MIEHTGGVRSTVDIVTKHDNQLITGISARIGNDERFQAAKLVQAAVHVPYRIDNLKPTAAC